MNRKGIYPIVFLLLLIATIEVVSAQSQIGISQGQTYTYVVTSNSNVPLIYGVVSSPKDVQTLTVKIQNITEPKTVTLTITQYFKNATETSLAQIKDLSSAAGFPMTLSDLTIGDKLWSAESASAKVNSTETVAYEGSSRQINRASVGPSETGYDLVDFSFDRQTGMPTQVSYVESDDISTTLTMTSTSVWTIPEFTNVTVIVLVGALVSVSILLIYRRPNKIAQ
jgi:hypothetical protein